MLLASWGLLWRRKQREGPGTQRLKFQFSVPDTLKRACSSLIMPLSVWQMSLTLICLRKERKKDGTKLCLTLVSPWTVARHAPLSVGFSRQEYWSGVPFPSPRGTSWPRNWNQVCPHCRQMLYQLSYVGRPSPLPTYDRAAICALAKTCLC